VTTTNSRTAAAIQARRQHAAGLLGDVQHALHEMRRDHTRITVCGLARRAGVSRTFLYQNPEARQLVDEAINDSTTQHGADRQANRQRDELNAIWRERALNAEDALAGTNREIRQQRQRIADLMGQVRDLEHTWSHDGLQRLVTENTTLKQRIRLLTDDNQTLTDKLAAARSNARFFDRRIADLEFQLLELSSSRGADS
jgi:polyhydroxyalkanoate synthesis regulator phasin